MEQVVVDSWKDDWRIDLHSRCFTGHDPFKSSSAAVAGGHIAESAFIGAMGRRFGGDAWRGFRLFGDG